MTNENPPDCLILAGGLSRRMGFDKASINMDGQTLLSRMVEVMIEHGMRTCVVLGPNSDECDIDPDSVMFVRNNSRSGQDRLNTNWIRSTWMARKGDFSTN